MSSIPVLMNLMDEFARDPIHFGNDFGLGLHPHHIHRPAGHAHHHEPLGYTMPLSVLNRLDDRQLSRRCDPKQCAKVAPVGKHGFQVNMDVAQFKPSELTVKVADNHVIVEGRHEERQDEHGYISRHFSRRYTLPEGYDADRVMSTLSSDGVLTVSIPKPQLEDKNGERIIQIQQVGPAHLNVKQNTVEGAAGDANGAAEK